MDGQQSQETGSVEVDLTAHEYYFNRAISHLQFNKRVLEQALDDNHPLLNRLLFCCIFSSNMDELFEIRVAGLNHQNVGLEQI